MPNPFWSAAYAGKYIYAFLHLNASIESRKSKQYQYDTSLKSILNMINDTDIMVIRSGAGTYTTNDLHKSLKRRNIICNERCK